MALLEAIVESVGNAADGALRDFAAKALSEFMRWSIKNISKKQQEKNPFNVKSLLKRLYSLAHHPNPYKRLGFALTISQLYSIFKEEEGLVDMFVLEILHNCIFSLRLAHNDDSSLGTADKVAHVISQFAHLVSKKSVLLAQENNSRRVHKSLGAFVEWLFKEIGRSETRCRTECMALFNRFAPLLPSCRSTASWIQEKIRKDKLQSLLPIFEPADLRPPPERFTVEKELNAFLFGVLTSLDCYAWVFSEVRL
jgi:DNA-dependent protein kinase catalytic subunit